ncbi:hypothetical protein [Nocardia mangyaensis]|uniref:hypothetical protein n=1 Tax=Nocardia mangyaensis TaxID=2213200 RepID=UPI002675E98C|nr:hypothetical protein [Nocardia mangyaensis]MDO3646148.1 hypothetical protein [Nocardia mangyaensis]
MVGIDEFLDSMELVLTKPQFRVVGAGLPGEAGRAQVMLRGQSVIGEEPAELDDALPVALVDNGDHRDRLAGVVECSQPVENLR